jgi:hypothetical protein
MDYTGSATASPGGERIRISTRSRRFQCVVMKAKMTFNECAYKKITVIVTPAQVDRCRIIRRLAGGNEVIDFQLLGQEFIRVSLIHQQGQMFGGARGFDQ